MDKKAKIKKRLRKAFNRKRKRVEKDLELIRWYESKFDTFEGFSKAKSRQDFYCEMGCSYCEERGYCNGDC